MQLTQSLMRAVRSNDIRRSKRFANILVKLTSKRIKAGNTGERQTASGRAKCIKAPSRVKPA